MAAARIYFLRHAQGTHNAAAALVGAPAYLDPAHRDAALTPEGVRQAWGVRESRRLGEFDTIYCSPLRRCQQTLLTAGPGADRRLVRLDDRLMEPQGAAICNRRAEREELRRQVPAGWCLDGVRALNPFDVLTEGGTVGADGHTGFEARVRAFTESELVGLPRGSRVLVVGHHDWIRTWFRLYRPESGSGVSLGNCEWVTAEV